MAEEQAQHGEAAAEAEHGGGGAMEHILDRVLVGVDQASGKVVTHPYEQRAVAYAPRMLGPFKLEFTLHMADLTAAALVFFVLAYAAARAVRRGLDDTRAPRGPLANAIEAIIVFVRDELVVPVGGHHLGHYTPIFLTYFFLILTCNLIGLIPTAGSATGNLGVTLGLAASVYLLIWLLGVWNQGAVGFLKNMVPPGTPWWMWPLMFLLEILGPVIKCFVLSVRLFANMIAGHLIIGTVLSLGAFGGALSSGLALLILFLGIPLALGISGLEVLVCFIQAYVFTLLAVVFIGAAVHPEH